MVESIFDKMASEAASKWRPKPEPVPVRNPKQLIVRPEYRVGGKYRGRL